MHVCLCVHMCLCEFMCVFVSICVHTVRIHNIYSIHIEMHTHTHTHTNGLHTISPCPISIHPIPCASPCTYVSLYTTYSRQDACVCVGHFVDLKL